MLSLLKNSDSVPVKWISDLFKCIYKHENMCKCKAVALDLICNVYRSLLCDSSLTLLNYF